MKKKIIYNIISIAAPILLMAAVVFVITYGWYVKRQQTADINATTKNVAIEYTFDDDTTKNVVEYKVENIAFFDADSTDDNKIELKYLPVMAVKLDIKLLNKSSNDVSYKITFEALKSIVSETVEGNTVNKSIAYMDCVFYDITNIPSSVTTVNGIKALTTDGVTYTNTASTSTNKAEYDSSSLSTPLVLSPVTDEDTASTIASKTVTLSMYIYGVQEIDNAANDDFLYEYVTENNVTTKKLKQYEFSITIESIPQGEVNVSENGSNNNSGND
ncbi:MAG: hypothetical protein IJP63_00895 [Acholeplasmatales bacterium]|nr:hypothetical protein [Acholeplasmatales bacterium]